MTFAVTYRCPGCGKNIGLAEMDLVAGLLDKPYHSLECMQAHALAEENVDTTLECPRCHQRQVEVGRTGKKRCANNHVWEDRDGEAVYLRDLSEDELAHLAATDRNRSVRGGSSDAQKEES